MVWLYVYFCDIKSLNWVFLKHIIFTEQEIECPLNLN